MTCDACTRAAANPLTGRYSRGCHECDIRALAHAQEYATAEAAGTIFEPAYKAELERLAGPGQPIDDTHRRVRSWAKRIKRAQATQPSKEPG